MENKAVKIAFTPGDPNGIGPEIILRMLEDQRMLQDMTPLVYGNEKIFNFYRKTLEESTVQFNKVRQASQAQPGKINLITCWEGDPQAEPGKITPEGGKLALQALEAAFADIAAGHADCLVTAPVNKENIASTTPGFTGHTNWLAEKAGVKDILMILMSQNLRVGLLTEHIPLSQVAAAITPALIEAKVKRFEQCLKIDFGIRKPRMALLGLNPHAGDGGILGTEEQAIILPTVQRLRAESDILTAGPFPADGFFGKGSYNAFDGVLAMYHDQGLAPFKALTFGKGVNFTAGLPFVRTSPDHGTAYDIAGQGKAAEDSLRNATYVAIDVFKSRLLEKDLRKNPLKTSEISRERS